MTEIQIVLAVIFAVMNVLGFSLMGIDKNRAQQNKWRVRETVFFVVALCLGALGTNMGMHYFRHKTQHWQFKIGLPICIGLNLATITLLSLF